MDIKQTKNELLKDREFMENIFKYTQKRRSEEFDIMIKKFKTSPVEKATNDDKIKN